MRPPLGRNIGSLLMTDPSLPRKANGDPHQALFHWDDKTGEKHLALGPNGIPLVWARSPYESEDHEDWTVEEAPPEIAAAVWEWLAGEHS